MRGLRVRSLMALVAAVALVLSGVVEVVNHRRRDAAAFLEWRGEGRAVEHERAAAICRDAIRRGLPPDPARRLPTINGGSFR